MTISFSKALAKLIRMSTFTAMSSLKIVLKLCSERLVMLSVPQRWMRWIGLDCLMVTSPTAHLKRHANRLWVPWKRLKQMVVWKSPGRTRGRFYKIGFDQMARRREHVVHAVADGNGHVGILCVVLLP